MRVQELHRRDEWILVTEFPPLRIALQAWRFPPHIGGIGGYTCDAARQPSKTHREVLVFAPYFRDRLEVYDTGHRTIIRRNLGRIAKLPWHAQLEIALAAH